MATKKERESYVTVSYGSYYERFVTVCYGPNHASQLMLSLADAKEVQLALRRVLDSFKQPLKRDSTATTRVEG
jgi:hypothetical protein